eukprot:CAMPEP_0114557812 /NCGR_PEP_ID=MMETSP0114-20121206/10035_1 /TAXON_ID=31324 /ORGANISM="Goniomonas sp, Strain m" /LENGTH=290 /DNA_ID=CAMNT_0001743135 /DNA_START=30 /DNA_END=899 /DNA_ORIENTATION=-
MARLPVFTLFLTALLAGGVSVITQQQFPGKTVLEILGVDLGIPDHYGVLGVGHNVGDEALKRAYRDKALLYHPDKNPAPDASQKFAQVSNAFEILQDHKKRFEYDLQYKQADEQRFLQLPQRLSKFGAIALGLLFVLWFVFKFESLYYQRLQVEADLAAFEEEKRQRREAERQQMLAEVERQRLQKEMAAELQKEERRIQREEAEARALEQTKRNLEGQRAARQMQQSQLDALRDVGEARREQEKAEEKKRLKKREEWREKAAPNTFQGRGGGDSGHAWQDAGRGMRADG